MHPPLTSTGNKSKEHDDSDHNSRKRPSLLDGDASAAAAVAAAAAAAPPPLTSHSSEYQASVTQPSASTLAQQNFRNRPRRGLGMAAANNLPMLPAGLLNQQPGQPEDWLVYYNNQSSQGLSSLFNHTNQANSDLMDHHQYMAAHHEHAPDINDTQARSIYGEHASAGVPGVPYSSSSSAAAAAAGAAGPNAGHAGGPHHMQGLAAYNAHEYHGALNNYMDHKQPLGGPLPLGGASSALAGGGPGMGAAGMGGGVGGPSGLGGPPGMGGGITTTSGAPGGIDAAGTHYDIGSGPPAFLPHNVAQMGLSSLGPSRLNSDNAGIPHMAPMHMVVAMSGGRIPGGPGGPGTSEENVIDDGSDTDGGPLHPYHTTTTKLIDSENSAHDELYEKEMSKIPESFYRSQQHNPTHPGALRTRRRSSRKQSNSFSSSYEDGLEESLTAAASQRQVDAAGTPWLVFEYPESQAKRQLYRIRCDIANLDLEIFDDKFRQQNCVYPKAMVPPEMYSGHRQGYETKCNEIGWKLAYMNPTLCGQRGLIQRAVDTYRNTNDLSTRSRRARRIARQQQKSGRLAKGSSG